MKQEKAPKVVHDTLIIREVELSVEIRWIEQRKLQFFVDNPRIYSLVRNAGKSPTQDEIEEKLLDMEHVRRLIIDIKENGGLVDPLIVKAGSMEVLEGNSRLAAYRYLAAKDPLRWARVKCTVLPQEIDEALIFALLGQYHIKGKKDWAPYEQAGFLYRRHRIHKIDTKTLAEEIGLKERAVQHLIATYQFMIDHKENDTERWSYYDEYLKSPNIRKARKTYPELDKVVVDAIRTQEIPKAVDVREHLPRICAADSHVLEEFATRRITFPEAVDAVPEQDDAAAPLRKLEAFRSWLTRTDVETTMLQAKPEMRKKLNFELGKIESRARNLKAKT
jgi:hypothetical protein